MQPAGEPGYENHTNQWDEIETFLDLDFDKSSDDSQDRHGEHQSSESEFRNGLILLPPIRSERPVWDANHPDQLTKVGH